MYWSPPEIVTQNKIGTEGDIWSLGCTVLEMVSGLPPWYNCTGIEDFYRKLN